MTQSYVPVYKRPKKGRKRKPHRRTLASKVNHLSTEVNRMMREEEKKFVDITYSESVPDLAAATVAPNIVNLIPQGDGANARNGARCSLDRWALDYWFTPLNSCTPATTGPVGAGSPVGAIVRLILVWFPGVGAADPTDISLDNVLEDPTNIQSHYKKNGKVRFERLADRMHSVYYRNQDESSVGGVCTPTAGGEYRCQLALPQNRILTFRDSTADTPVRGVLCFYVINQGTDGLGANSAGTWRGQSRITFTDD